jgi:DNA polymerase-3 subunit epsilon
MSTVVPESLSQLEVLVVDCQATAAAPHGHLLEMGWARAGATTTDAHVQLVALPNGKRIPPAVARLTGISETMVQDGVDARVAWRELSNEAATLARQPAPTVIHFARFEQPFLRALAGGTPPLDIVCTHDIARRLLPDLPRRGVRALTGYFGRGVSALRRSADHVEATAFVWRELVRLLQDEGISTWSALQEWLAVNRATRKRRRRVWPMPPDVRLSLPDAPGVYRLLRTSGDVLYVGKAASLRHRVNSYFRKQNGMPERTLEMLSQARGISFDVTPSALEAALFEPDEIKRHRPPYNVALTVEDRVLWFTAPGLSARSAHPWPQCPLGPSLPPRCSMNLLRSPGLTAARSVPVAGVPTQPRSMRVTRRSARCTPNCRVTTSARTRDCCGSAHACGEKVDETTTSTRMKRLAASRPGHQSSCNALWSGSRCARRSRAAARCG